MPSVQTLKGIAQVETELLLEKKSMVREAIRSVPFPKPPRIALAAHLASFLGDRRSDIPGSSDAALAATQLPGTSEPTKQMDALTVSEVAKLLRCSKAHVCKAITGEIQGLQPIPAVRIGRRMLVLRKSLTAWLLQNEHGNGSATLPTSLEIDAVRRA